MTAEFLAFGMFAVIALTLLSGFPVAFVLSGVSLVFALIGHEIGVFELSYLSALPNRIYGVMTSDLLVAVPLFVFMGCMLERAKIAEELLETTSALFGALRGGLGIAVALVGALLAASTGIVGATVVTMGLISLPTMLRNQYDPKLATGIICAAGTLGQVIPPSIVLILLGDQISSAYQNVQMQAGAVSSDPVSIADLFVGAIIPGLLLVAFYIGWLLVCGVIRPKAAPAMCEIQRGEIFADGIFRRIVSVLLPPLALILVVLGSILGGFATATESAAVGAVGAMILAGYRRQFTLDNLKAVMHSTTKVTSMVFTILIGAAIFTLVFRGFGGDDMIHDFMQGLPGGVLGAMAVTMLVMFLLGFFLDFIEIIFVIVPIVAPVLLAMGVNPVWLAVMMAVNLQTSFLTPPFGFSLFYLRGVAPESVKTSDIYKGVIPFVIIQIAMLGVLSIVPELATWLPDALYGSNFSASAIPVEFAPSYESIITDDMVDF